MNNDLLTIHQHVMGWIQNLKMSLPTLMVDIQVDTKKDEKDLVTNIDKQVQQILTDSIESEFPGHFILGEEAQDSLPEDISGDVWIIDPIDGTTNFVKQSDHYAIMMAYFKDGIGQLGYIYDVRADKLYYAIKDMGAFVDGHAILPPESRSLHESLISIDVISWYQTKEFTDLANQCFDLRYFGCSGIESIHILEGKFGAYINKNAGAWDLAPQVVFAHELGLKISQLDGTPVDYVNGGEVIFSNEGCYHELLNIFNKQSAQK